MKEPINCIIESRSVLEDMNIYILHGYNQESKNREKAAGTILQRIVYEEEHYEIGRTD